MYVILITLPVGARLAYGPFETEDEAHQILDPLLNPALPAGTTEVIPLYAPAVPGTREKESVS